MKLFTPDRYYCRCVTVRRLAAVKVPVSVKGATGAGRDTGGRGRQIGAEVQHDRAIGPNGANVDMALGNVRQRCDDIQDEVDLRPRRVDG